MRETRMQEQTATDLGSTEKALPAVANQPQEPEPSRDATGWQGKRVSAAMRDVLRYLTMPGVEVRYMGHNPRYLARRMVEAPSGSSHGRYEYVATPREPTIEALVARRFIRNVGMGKYEITDAGRAALLAVGAA